MCVYCRHGVGVPVFEMPLHCCASFDPPHPLPQNGDTALIRAAGNGHVAVCIALVDKGDGVDLVNTVCQLRDSRGTNYRVLG